MSIPITTSSDRVAGGVASRRGHPVQALISATLLIAVSVGFAVVALGDKRAATLGTRVEPPADMVRAGLLPPARLLAPAPTLLATLGWSLWRAPLEQKLANRYYVEAGRRGDADGADRWAGLMSRLGWRDTPTTQNLMLRHALGDRYGAMVDRGESLLRREQLEDSVFRFFGALETLPAMQSRLVARLHQHVPWRERYLATMTLADNDRFRAARVRTFTALMAAGDRVGRPELAPFLTVLSMRGDDALGWRLWRRAGGLRGVEAGLADTDFSDAHRLRASGEPVTPFDWQLGAADGFAASVPDYRPRGVSLRWNGRGVPVFLMQRLRLPGASRLVATVTTDQPQAVVHYLEPTLTCDGHAIAFEPIGVRGAAVAYAIDLPAGCGFATFAVQGKVTDDPSPDAIEVASITLRPA